jgi:hypothetical protein
VKQLNDSEISVIVNLLDVPVILEDGDSYMTIEPEYKYGLFVKPLHVAASKFLCRTEWQVASGVNLPTPCQGVYFIVSKAVKAAFPERRDFVIPVNIKRDGDMSRITCKRFAD